MRKNEEIEVKTRNLFADYIILENQLLGKGNFGTVYKGYRKSDPKKHYAIKIINLCDISETLRESLPKIIENEIISLLDLEHPNIIELIEYKFEQKFIYLITEFCSEGDLKNKIGKISIQTSMKYFEEIVKAMVFANKNGYIHRDLKPENVLISKENNVKIGDFGLAKFMPDPDIKMKMTMVGSFLYMAPEVYKRNTYSKKCDVWSAGILLYQMIYGKTPWNGLNVIHLHAEILKVPLSFEEKKGVSESLKDLIRNMLQIDQDKRLSFEDILMHKALKKEENSKKKDSKEAPKEKFEEEKEKKPPKYLEYLKNMGYFFGKLAEEVRKERKAIGLSRRTCLKLTTLLKKVEVMSLKKIKWIVSGKETNLKEIPKEMREKKALNMFRTLYKGSFEEVLAEFMNLIDKYQKKYEGKDEEFERIIVNQDWNLSEEFKKEYNRIFLRFIEVFCEKFNRKTKELQNDKDITDETFKLLRKLIRIRKFSNVKKYFPFKKEGKNEDLFLDFEKKIEGTQRKKLVEKIIQYKERFIEE